MNNGRRSLLFLQIRNRSSREKFLRNLLVNTRAKFDVGFCFGSHERMDCGQGTAPIVPDAFDDRSACADTLTRLKKTANRRDKRR